MPITRRSKRWLTLLIILVSVLAGLHIGRNWIARKALENVARQAEKGNYQAKFDGVEVDLFSRHIRITGLSITPILAADSLDLTTAGRATFTIHAGTIELQGVDMEALIRRNILHVGHVRILSPEIVHTFVTHTTKRAKAAAQRGSRPIATKGLDLLHLDTLLIADATGRSQNLAKASPAMSITELDLLITGITISEGKFGKLVLGISSAQVAMREASAHLEPYYTLGIDSLRIRLPEDSAVIFGLHYTPDVNAQQYHHHVKTQVELYKASVDTILLTGFDLPGQLQEGILRAKALYISGLVVDIHRDKSLPLPAERPRKPLLAERVQDWSVPVALDRIDVRRGRLTYHERFKVGEPYGALTLAAINARLNGLNNMNEDGHTELHLKGSARLWNKARADLDMRMTKRGGPTQLEMRVAMKDLAATELNRMTDDLVHVSATHGRIHSVDMHLKGDDRAAQVTVDVQYDSLSLELSPAIKHSGILSFAANTVVRSSNMPGRKGYRVGHVEVVRRQETSSFNYLWIGLREGMVDVMLPPVVLKKLRKPKGRKVRD